MSRQAPSATSAESTAQNRVAPVVGNSTREVYSDDLPIAQPRALPANLMPGDRDADVIIASESVLTDGYAEELAFMQEMVTIVLYKKREKFAPPVYDFHVNSKGIRVWCDVPTRIPRHFLEVIARSQPYDVTTEVNKNEDKGDQAVVQNFAHRHQSAAYPFTVVEDKNPRGAAWLMQVMRES